MEVKQEFGNTIYNDGTIAMKVKYIFEDVVPMMLFFKDEIWGDRVEESGNIWEVNRRELTITCTSWVQALDHYNSIIGEEEE